MIFKNPELVEHARQAAYHELKRQFVEFVREHALETGDPEARINWNEIIALNGAFAAGWLDNGQDPEEADEDPIENLFDVVSQSLGTYCIVSGVEASEHDRDDWYGACVGVVRENLLTIAFDQAAEGTYWKFEDFLKSVEANEL